MYVDRAAPLENHPCELEARRSSIHAHIYGATRKIGVQELNRLLSEGSVSNPSLSNPSLSEGSVTEG